MRFALAVALVLLAACGTAGVRPSDPGPAKLHVPTAALLVPVPLGWHAEIAPEPHPLRGFNHASLSKGGVTLWLRMSAGPGSYPLRGESMPDPFPLDWGRATMTRTDLATHTKFLGVPFLTISSLLFAEIPDGSDPRIDDEIAAIVRGVTPEPVPAQGRYREWRAVGRASDFGPGSVTRIAHSARSGSWRPPDVSAFYVVRGATSIRALIDSADIDFERRCRVGYDPASELFRCEDLDVRWTKHGVPLDGQQALPHYLVAILDGVVLVGGAWIGGSLSPD
jgi:hypothetical protein